MESFAAGISALGVKPTVSSKPARYYVPQQRDAQTKLPKHFVAVAGEF